MDKTDSAVSMPLDVRDPFHDEYYRKEYERLVSLVSEMREMLKNVLAFHNNMFDEVFEGYIRVIYSGPEDWGITPIIEKLIKKSEGEGCD